MSDPIELMYMALGTPLGICIQVSDFERVQQKLYVGRRKCADPALDCLQFTRSPFNPESELWIIKSGKVDGQALATIPIPPTSDKAEHLGDLPGTSGDAGRQTEPSMDGSVAQGPDVRRGSNS